MPKRTLRRAPRATACLVLCAALLAAAPAVAKRVSAKRHVQPADMGFDLTVLNPAYRDSLQDIRVLFLDENNLELVWRLASEPGLADVIVVSCSPKCLSSDVLEELAAWARLGHGLFLGAPAIYPASRFLLPAGYFIEPDYFEIPIGFTWVEKAEPFADNVGLLRHELWCSRTGTGTLDFGHRDEELGVETHPEAALVDLDEVFTPVVSWKRYLRDEDDLKRVVPQERRTVMLATTWEGARVVWYAYDLERKRLKDCEPHFDDVRLWSNLVHWLAGRSEEP